MQNNTNLDQTALFTGDCLFEGGVGKFFEGNATMMYEVFDQMFTHRFPENTWNKTHMFYGHDYGWKNIKWAKDYMD